MFLRVIILIFMAVITFSTNASEIGGVKIDGGGIYLNDRLLNENIIKASTYSYRVFEENEDGELKIIRYTFLSSTNQSCIFNMRIQDESIFIDNVICANSIYDDKINEYKLHMYAFFYNGLDVKEFGELPPYEYLTSEFNFESEEFVNVPVMSKDGKLNERKLTCSMKIRLLDSGYIDFYIETAKCK